MFYSAYPFNAADEQRILTQVGKGNEGKEEAEAIIWSSEEKGLWWMPGSCKAKKAVVSCEKPGGEAHILRFPDSRMG